MRILVNCYACSPYQGSEPGMGWNFVKGLLKHHELHILTENKYKEDLEKYFSEHPEEGKNIHIHYVKKNRHRKLRKIWPPSYYWFYQKWQKKVLRLARELDAKYDFDLIHQLNMVGYREPGYLFKLGKPFVWGPMGGFNITPWNLLSTMGLKGMVFFGMRNIINLWQMKHSARVAEAVRKSDAIITATEDDHKAVLNLWNKNSTVIPEVGFQASSSVQAKNRTGRLKLCWSGQHIPRKSLNLLLESMALIENQDAIELHVIGAGECTEKWKYQSERLGLNNIVWHGWVEKTEAMDIMSKCDVFVITSLSDATSTVLLEALSMGMPVIATNHLGFANVITNDCGIKVDLKKHKQIIRDFASAIERLESDEAYRLKLSLGAARRAKEFSWEGKISIINEIYKSVIEKYHS